MPNIFLKNHGPFKLSYLVKDLEIEDFKLENDFEIDDIKDLTSAGNNDITFYHSKRYKDVAEKTRARCCLTTKKLEDDLPSSLKKITVKNVLISTAFVTEKFYPNSINDKFDTTANLIEISPYKDKVLYGKNVLIGTNVKIGKNCSIGHNSILESNVIIGDDCNIGSNTIIRHSIIGNNVNILDNCIIGKKGFGFFPQKNKNHKYPHIGIVEINDNCEIGCGSTIDRGSLSNTIIGKNTYLDNQIHIAHNVKIGENSIIAGQVGVAGSSIIGNNVKIGGQAGISGHLKIGNNVEIGGGSGVIKSIPDNSKVMGYPAKNIKQFIKDNR